MHTLCNFQGNGIGFRAVLSPMYLHAVGREIGLKLFQQSRQMGQAVASNRGPQFAQPLQLLLIWKLRSPFGL